MTVDGQLYPPATAEHIVVDLHELAETLARVEAGQAELLARNRVLTEAVAELTFKIGELEREFAPLARKFTGRAAALASTPAARFVRSKARDQHE